MLVFGTTTEIQQRENQERLRTFQKFETSLNFEEYWNKIDNIKHRQAAVQNSESLLIDCLSL